jgi:hypothetical protein
VGTKRLGCLRKKRSDHLADDGMDNGGFKNCCRYHRKNQLSRPSWSLMHGSILLR